MLSKPVFQPQAGGQQTILYLSQTLINGKLPPPSFFVLKAVRRMKKAWLALVKRNTEAQLNSNLKNLVIQQDFVRCFQVIVKSLNADPGILT